MGRSIWVGSTLVKQALPWLLLVVLAALFSMQRERAIRAETLARVRADSLHSVVVEFGLRADSILQAHREQKAREDALLNTVRRHQIADRLADSTTADRVDSLRAALDVAGQVRFDSVFIPLRRALDQARTDRGAALALVAGLQTERADLTHLLAESRQHTALALTQLNQALKRPFWDKTPVKVLIGALAVKGAADFLK